MIYEDSYPDQSMYNKCEFCTGKSMNVFYDPNQKIGMGKHGVHVFSCNKHKEMAKVRLKLEIIKNE